MFTIRNQAFSVSPVREEVPNRVVSLSRIKERLKRNQYNYVVVTPHKNKKDLLVSFNDVRSHIDYGAFVYDKLVKAGDENAIFIEQRSEDDFFIMQVEDGSIQFDRIETKNQALRVVNEIFLYRDDKKNYRTVAIGNVTDEFEALINQHTTLEISPSLLSDQRYAGNDFEPLADFRYKQPKQALKKEGVKRPRVKTTWAAIASVIAVALFITLDDEEVKRSIQIIDPYEDYKALVTEQLISPVERMRFDYNMHIGLLNVPGWDLVNVEHMPSVSSYTVAQSSRGALSQLNKFADSNSFAVRKSTEGYELVTNPPVNPVHQTGPNEVPPIHDLEQVTNLFIDAIQLWVPGTVVAIQRDVKNRDDDWAQRQVVVSLAGHHKEDLLTIASIIEALELPIALTETSYRFSEEEITGNFIFNIVGKV